MIEWKEAKPLRSFDDCTELGGKVQAIKYSLAKPPVSSLRSKSAWFAKNTVSNEMFHLSAYH